MRIKNFEVMRLHSFFNGFMLHGPIAVIYFSQVSGSFALGMSIFSIEMVSSALFEIPTGIFSDRIGRRKTIILGSIAGFICILIYASSNTYQLLFAGSIVAGFARSLFSGNNEALLHDSLKEIGIEKDFYHYYSKVGVMEQLALGIAAVVGSIIAAWSLRNVYWLSLIPQTACIFFSLQFIEPKVHSNRSGNIYLHLKEAVKHFARNKKLRLLTLASSTTFAMTESSFQFRSAFYQTLWPIWALGFAKAIANIGATLSFHYSGRVLKKIGALKSLVIGNVFGRVMNIIGTAFPTVFSPLIMSSTSIIYGIFVVAKESLLQKEFKQEQRATMGSLNSFAGSILYGIVAICLGLVADSLNPAKALLIFQFITALTIIFYLLIARHDKIAKENSNL